MRRPLFRDAIVHRCLFPEPPKPFMNTPAARDESGITATVRLLIGVGASAADCCAFSELMQYIEPRGGCSLLLVHEADTPCEHILEAAQQKGWRARVVRERETLVDRSVFIVPPGQVAEIRNGVLLVSQIEAQSKSTPIDQTFQSLADEFGEYSVGVVLSGKGSDGTYGMKAIGDAGGITFTQAPGTAKYESMPSMEAKAGAADHSLPIDRLGAELMRYVQFMLDKSATLRSERHLLVEIEQSLPKVAELLLEHSNHNFQHYKPTTLSRRIMRRMQLLKVRQVEAYLQLLSEKREERESLFNDLLIGVSSFFRDAEAFHALAETVLRPFFEGRGPSDSIRIWVPGCASGEEAYTIAMLCREEIGRRDGSPTVQIFATDIDESALHRARRGAYAAGISEQMPAYFLDKYFVQSGKQFHVTTELREMVHFCKHNLISDPPFIRQDLISCRNLLIYLGSHLQNKLIPLFHYALQPGGYLMLGPAENISAHQQLFHSLSPKHRIAQRREAAVGITLSPEAHRRFLASQSLSHEALGRAAFAAGLTDDRGDVYQIMQRTVLDEFSPKSAVINEAGEIICSSGNINVYLEIPTGTFRNSIFKLARGGLAVPLRALVSEAKRIQRRVSHQNLAIRIDREMHRLALTVQPMPELGKGCGLFLVVFQDLGLPESPERAREQDEESQGNTAALIVQLERELEAARSELEQTTQDMEAANEELKSSNEELLSMNEELQSANEELELSKEEIQAGVEALEQANTDLENLLRSTQIATIFLDRDSCIRSFTPAATRLYGLLGTDVGRPLSQLRPIAEAMPEMPSISQLEREEMVEQTFALPNGETYMRRVLPYRTGKGDVDGIVVTFTDITELVRAYQAARQQEQQLYRLMDAIPALVAYVTSECRYRFVNQAYCEEFKRERKEIIGMTVEELIGPFHYLQVSPQLDRAMTGERVRYECIWQMHAEEPTRYLEVNYVPDVEEDGTVTGCYVLIVDITERKRQSLALADRERRLQSLISSTAEGIFGMDANGICTFANGASARLLGYASPSELLGKDMHALVHHSFPDGSPYPIDDCLIRKAFVEGKEIHVNEEVFWREDGSAFDVEYWSYPQFESGEVVGCVVTFLDITQRRQWERELEDREAHLRRAIDNMLGFVGILALDGTLLEANANAIDAAGVPRSDLVGKKYWDCYWFNYDETIQEQLRDAVARAVQGTPQRYDVEIRTSGDQRMTIDFQLVPVFDDNHRVTYLIPSGIDISDRLRAEAAYRRTSQAIRDNEERLAMALRAGGMAAWEWSPEGSVWTPEVYDLLGISPNEPADSETFFNHVHPDDLPSVRRGWEHALANESTYEQEFRIIRPDGSIRWVVGMGQVVHDEKGDMLRLFGLNWDSTKEHLAADALRESERQAQQANLAKSQFIANMSHEIRTPMTAVLGYTDLLLSKEADSEKAEHLQTIKRNGKFLLEIINDILDLSKIEAGKLEVDRQEFAPHEIFADVQSMMKVRAKARNLEFRLSYQTPIPKLIRSDEKRFKQILVNLVGNAIKFTEQGCVDLQVSFERQPKPRLRFDVVDTGIGMTEEQQSRLFQSFSQGDPSVNRKFGGTGLGLAISRRLATMLGGEIWVHSELNRGSTFSCAIDPGDIDGVELIDANAHPTCAAEVDVHVDLQLDCRILVVDDRRDVRHLTRHFLSQAGASVELAEDGMQAIERISQVMRERNEQPFDLILLDMQMPRLDGYETARELRNMGFQRPIIALTADAMQGDMSRCIASGCDSYISKPIDGPALLQAVARHLGSGNP
jgi:two-component system, chemotaxis family, CheB/CheR fusion protein